MNGFNLHGRLIAYYSEYACSYITIRAERISRHVAQRLDEGSSVAHLSDLPPPPPRGEQSFSATA